MFNFDITCNDYIVCVMHVDDYYCKKGFWFLVSYAVDAANLRPALEQNCGKQTPSDRKLFSRANLLHVPNIKM